MHEHLTNHHQISGVGGPRGQRGSCRVSVQGVKKFFVIIFQKEIGNTFTLFIIFIEKVLQKEQNNTNLLL